MLNNSTRDTLLIIKGWLIGVREEQGVGYYSYINAIDRLLGNRATEFDIRALENLRFELMRHWNTPRSQQEAVELEKFVNGLNEAIRINSIQLQPTS